MSDRETAHKHLNEARTLLEEAEVALTLNDPPYPANAYWKQLTRRAEAELKAARKAMTA